MAQAHIHAYDAEGIVNGVSEYPPLEFKGDTPIATVVKRLAEHANKELSKPSDSMVKIDNSGLIIKDKGVIAIAPLWREKEGDDSCVSLEQGKGTIIPLYQMGINGNVSDLTAKPWFNDDDYEEFKYRMVRGKSPGTTGELPVCLGQVMGLENGQPFDYSVYTVKVGIVGYAPPVTETTQKPDEKPKTLDEAFQETDEKPTTPAEILLARFSRTLEPYFDWAEAGDEITQQREPERAARIPHLPL